jgi:hypothetical protein
MIVHRAITPIKSGASFGLNPEPSTIIFETDQRVAQALKPTLSPIK